MYGRRGKAVADLIGLEGENPATMDTIILRHVIDNTKYRRIPGDEIIEIETLLVDVLHEGRRLGEAPTMEEMRALRQRHVDLLYPGVRRLMNPHNFHVSLTQQLSQLKQE